MLLVCTRLARLQPCGAVLGRFAALRPCFHQGSRCEEHTILAAHHTLVSATGSRDEGSQTRNGDLACATHFHTTCLPGMGSGYSQSRERRMRRRGCATKCAILLY